MPAAYRVSGLAFSVYVMLIASSHDLTSISRGVAYSVESLAIAWLVWRAIDNKRHVVNLIDLLIGVMFVGALLAVYETAAGHYLLPVDEPFFFHAALRVGGIRAQGVFPHSLVLGTALAVMLPIAISRCLSTTGLRRIFSAAAILLYALTLILISGRGPWVGAAIAVIALIALTRGSKRLTIITGALICIVAVAASPVEGKIASLATSLISNENGQETVNSVRYRKALLTASFSYAETHPFGTAPGRQEAAHLTGGLEEGTHLSNSIDNAYAQYAVELGPIGLLFFLFIIGNVVMCAWDAHNVKESELALVATGILAGEIAMLVASTTVATFEWQQLAALFWPLVGASFMIRPLAQPTSQPASFRWKDIPIFASPTKHTRSMQPRKEMLDV